MTLTWIDWLLLAIVIAAIVAMEWFLAEKVYEPRFEHELARSQRAFDASCRKLDERFDSMERFIVERVRVIEVNQNVGMDGMRAVK